MDRTHRRYSPSFAPTLFKCRGAANLLRRVPARPDTVWSIEGTKAHTVLQAALENGVRDAQVAHREHSSLFFEDLDDGTNNFYFAIQVALDYIYDLHAQYPDGFGQAETYVEPPTVNAPGEAGGWCDYWFWVPSARILYIIDYKHGAGVTVEADSNQLLQYAAGMVFSHTGYEPKTVVCCVVQPRAFHKEGSVREYETTPFRIWEYLQELDDKIGEAERPDAPLSPGVEQCRFCDAAAFCPAREASALSVADATFRQIRDVTAKALPSPYTMDMNRLALIRAHAPELRAWLDAVDTRCYELAREGHAIPGAKLVQATPKRVYFGDDMDIARRVAAMIGAGNPKEAMDAYEALMVQYPVLKTLFRTKFIPLTDAEKLAVEAYKRRAGTGKKKQAAENARHDFAYLTVKETSGTLTLVDESDPRPAINATRNAFAQVMQPLAAMTHVQP